MWNLYILLGLVCYKWSQAGSILAEDNETEKPLGEESKRLFKVLQGLAQEVHSLTTELSRLKRQSDNAYQLLKHGRGRFCQRGGRKSGE